MVEIRDLVVGGDLDRTFRNVPSAIVDLQIFPRQTNRMELPFGWEEAIATMVRMLWPRALIPQTHRVFDVPGELCNSTIQAVAASVPCSGGHPLGVCGPR